MSAIEREEYLVKQLKLSSSTYTEAEKNQQRTELKSLSDYLNHPKNNFSGKKFDVVKLLIEHIENAIKEEFPTVIFKYSPSGISLYADSGGRSKFAGIFINKALAQIVLIRDHRHEYRKPIVNGIKATNRVNKLNWIEWYKLELASAHEFVKNEEKVIQLFRESMDMKVNHPSSIIKEKDVTGNNASLLAKYLDPDYTYVVEGVKEADKVPKIAEVQTEEPEDERGYPALRIKMFKDAKIDKRRSQYTVKWLDPSIRYNLLLGIKANIPRWVDQFDNDDCCPQWSKNTVDKISYNIEKKKIIPVLTYVPEALFAEVKQVWWLCPFVILADNLATLLFIDKNGFYAVHPEDEDIDMVGGWDSIVNLDFDENWNGEENLVCLNLNFPDDGRLSIIEFVKPGKGSYLKVLHSIYKVYKPVIKASEGKSTWEHGAGNETYKAYDSVKELENDLGK